MFADPACTSQLNANKQKYLFIYRGLNTGGIETHILNTLNFLADIHADPSALHLCCAGGCLLSELNSTINITILDSFFPAHRNISLIANIITSSDSWIVLSFDPLSRAIADLAIQEALHSSRFIIAHHLSGAFHPRAYFHETDNYVTHVFNRLICLMSTPSSLYFMNKECLDNHKFLPGSPIAKSRVIHIPIRRLQYIWANLSYSQQRLRIASVGRLVRFKAYSVSLTKLIPNLLSKGFEVNLDIYGEGPLRQEILDVISQHGLRNCVRIKGVLPYKSFHEVLHKYDLFIGMGMSALEAASIGIPTILAIDNQPDDCYGFIYNVPLGCVGEVSPTVKITKLFDTVLLYAISSSSERKLISEKCKNYTLPLDQSNYLRKLNAMALSNPAVTYSALKRLLLYLLFSVRYWKPNFWFCP